LFSPYINRFIQPDSIVPNPASPQNLNRFGYVLNNPVNLVDPSGHRSCSTRQANTGDETCWQNIWSEFRNEMQNKLDNATQKGKLPRIVFDQQQRDRSGKLIRGSNGEPVTVAPQSEQEAFAFMRYGELAVDAFVRSIESGTPINSCNQLVAVMLGIKDVDGDGDITQDDYADPRNGLVSKNGSVFHNTYTSGANIVIFGSNERDPKGLVSPLHSGVIVNADKSNPLNTTLIQTNSSPSEYGIYFTTIESNNYYSLFSAWYLIK
jgi:hypothetical protein